MIAKLLRRPGVVATLLLSLHAALLAWAATRHSPAIDEVGHLAAGLSHWKFGRFDLYRVNPPLVRLVATAPVALMRPQMNWAAYSVLPGTRSEFDCGERFIAVNGARSLWFFTVARWACIPFSLLGGCVCYRWAGKLYGPAGGLLALSLWCFCPNVWAHAQMITPDVGATSTGAAACYLFWRWLRGPTWPRAFAAGSVLGLAELTKATFLVLYVVWPLAWIVWRLSARVGQAFQADGTAVASGDAQSRCDEHPTQESGLRQAAHLTVMVGLCLYVVNLGYAFEGSFHRLGDYRFISEALGGPRDPQAPDGWPGNRFAETPIADLRLPLPADYVLGVDQQKSDFERGYPSYLRGERGHRHGAEEHAKRAQRYGRLARSCQRTSQPKLTACQMR